MREWYGVIMWTREEKHATKEVKRVRGGENNPCEVMVIHVYVQGCIIKFREKLYLVREATKHERPPRVISGRESEFSFDTQLLAALFGKRELVIYDIPPNPTFA